MQSTKSSAQYDAAYKEGRQWLSDRDTAADISMLMFGFGGRKADPNAAGGRNTQMVVHMELTSLMVYQTEA